jgi:hypothetical protein
VTGEKQGGKDRSRTTLVTLANTSTPELKSDQSRNGVPSAPVGLLPTSASRVRATVSSNGRPTVKRAGGAGWTSHENR